MEIAQSRLLAPPCAPDDLLQHPTQEEYLAKLEKKLHRLQRGPAEKDKLVFKKGSAAELSRVANVNAEIEHLERRQELLSSPLVSTLSDTTPSAHFEADTELLLGSSSRDEISSIDAEQRYLADDDEGRSSSSDESNYATDKIVDVGEEAPQRHAEHESRINEDTICAGCTLQ